MSNMSTTYSYLQFVSYASIRNWSVQYMKGDSTLSSAFPIKLLGDFINEENGKYNISDPSKDYGILGVNNQTGIFDAYTENGAKIKQKYKKMEEGWIAYNPYRVNVGSVGVKRQNHRNEYISPAYVVFSCKSGLLPDFLYLMMRTPTFNNIIKRNTTGSVRQSLSYKNLSALRVPMPSIDEQRKLINSYFELVRKATLLLASVTNIEKDEALYVAERLGSEYSIEKDVEDIGAYRYLQFFHSRNIHRWDVWNINWTKRISHYKEVPLNKIITLQSGQFLPNKKQLGGEFIVYGGNGETGRHNEYCYSGKRIIIGRVGEYCGNVHLIDGKYWITDNAFKVDKVSDEVSWEFLSIALKSSKLNNYRSISAQPSISQGRILKLSIPVPPKEIQEEIVAYTKGKREQITNLRAEAQRLRQQALEEFEKELFK